MRKVKEVMAPLREAIPVLDHGMLRLIDSMGSDLSIVRNARVSYDAAWRAGEDKGSDARLIGYLVRNSHNTPLESVTLTYEIKAPIFVFRQLFRHRTISVNEISARYKALPNEFYTPSPESIGTQSSDNKQMRDEHSHNENAQAISAAIAAHNKQSYELYEVLLEQGCPRELARSVLGTGIYSHAFVTTNLHNLYKFIAERTHPHAQAEIRAYAQVLLGFAEQVAPVATAAFIQTQGHLQAEATP